MASLIGGFLLTLISPAFAPCHVGSFVGAPYRVTEGAGKVTVTYSNGAGAQPGGSVDYRTVDATAKAPADYKFTSGTLRWGTAGGTTSAASGVNPAYRSFEVPIRQERVDESTETFKIVMSHFTGCFDAGISDKTATVTIVDDDNPAPDPKQTSPTPAPQASTPASTQTQGAAATRRPQTPPATISPSPTSTGTSSPLASSPAGSDGGLSGGALAGIIAAVVFVGGGAALLVRRRFLT